MFPTEDIVHQVWRPCQGEQSFYVEQTPFDQILLEINEKRIKNNI